MIRLGIIGSRWYRDAEGFDRYVQECLRELHISYNVADCHESIIVATGDARGVDTLAVEWARRRDCIYVVFHAEAAWRTMGSKAGPIRTRSVVDFCDALIALPDRTSTGTPHGIARAKARGIPVAERTVPLQDSVRPGLREVAP